MDKDTKIKIIERTIIDDTKKPQLTAREKADMIKEYKDLTNKTNEQMENDIGLSAGCISQYIQLTETEYKSVNEMRRKENIGKFDFYEWINNGYKYTVNAKDIPLDKIKKDRIRILILRLRKIIGDGM